MEKGLLLLFLVFVIVGILHFLSLRSMALPAKRKKKFRKIFWYLYGAMFITLGLMSQLEDGRFSLLNGIQMVMGGLIFILNYLDKIQPGSQS